MSNYPCCHPTTPADSLYGITPRSVKKALAEILPQPFANGSDQKPATEYEDVSLASDEYLETIDESEAKMKRLAEVLRSQLEVA